jgi:threonine/homoserine/homoserine lactone efflux protein
VGGVKLLYVLAAHRVAAIARGARVGRAAEAGSGALLIGAGGYLILSLPR